MNYSNINNIERLGTPLAQMTQILGLISGVLFIVNIILFCISIKLKIKNKGVLFCLSILMFFLNYCVVATYNFEGALGMEELFYEQQRVKIGLICIFLIVQIIIFIKFLMKIKRKLKEKEEKSKCQE